MKKKIIFFIILKLFLKKKIKHPKPISQNLEKGDQKYLLTSLSIIKYIKDRIIIEDKKYKNIFSFFKKKIIKNKNG